MNTNGAQSPLRILLVEDSPHDQVAFRRAFKRSQVSVEITITERAEKALERLEADAASFDLVVTDYKLPDMSSLELCRELLEREVPLPLVLLTGAGTEHLAVEALQVGVDDYLIKDPGQGYLELLPVVLPNVVQKHRDRLDRQRAEEALRESEARYRAVVEDQTELICRFLPDGTLTFVNGAYCRYLGKKREELIGHSFVLLLPEENQSFVKKQFTSLSPEDPIVTYEHRILVPGGEMRWQQWTGRAIFDEQDRLVEFQSVGRDITERKRAEKEREKLIEELDAFAHTVAHDLKSPLSLIFGFADMLEEDHAIMPDEEIRDYLRAIMWSGHKASSIIDELLLLAGVRKVEKVEVEPLDMAGIVADAQQRLVYTIEKHQAEIILPDTWPVALGYSPWVEEVWVNYLSNAIKYGGQPPRVELGASPPSVLPACGEGAKGGRMVRFWVRDNGPGITPEEQARLFTPFTRLDQARTKGHGLGLSIVQRIVEKLGGQVGVESEAGRGSVFTFTLPATAS